MPTIGVKLWLLLRFAYHHLANGESLRGYIKPLARRYQFKLIASALDSRTDVCKPLANRTIQLIHIEDGINKDEKLGKVSAYIPDLLVSIVGNQTFKCKLLDVAMYRCLYLHNVLLFKIPGLGWS